MKDLTRFATEDFPLHPSALRTLIDCPWKIVMQFLYDPSDEGGAAGDTGSAVHAAAHALHEGKEVAACIGVMKDKLASYPKADLLDAADLFLKYAGDTRNRQAKVVLNEMPIGFKVTAAPEDPTGEPLIFVGRLDQVRDVDGRLMLYDIKSSKKDPMTLLHEHTFQMAAYCVGASVLLQKQVDPGALILVRRYKTTDYSNAPVFWHYAWTFQDCERILKVIRHRVAEVRKGILYHNPEESRCHWCHQRSPDICLPKLKKFEDSRVVEIEDKIPLDVVSSLESIDLGST